MRPLVALAAAALAASAAAACSPPPGAARGAPLAVALGGAAADWSRHEAAYRRASAAGRWEEAARALEAQVVLAPSPPDDPAAAEALDREVRVAFYNLACARSLLARHEAALDALEQALDGGAGVVGFDHLLRDPDLAPVRGDRRWEALLERLSWNGEVALRAPVGADRGPPAVVVRIGEGPAAEESAATGAAWVAVPAPPYRVAPGVLRWRTVLEPGERAAEKAVFALRAAEEAAGAPAGRRVLDAHGAEAVRVAWEVLLRRPGVFTHAVLDGPSPPAWVLLDRGGGKVETRVLAAGPGALPPEGVVASAEDAGSPGEALRRALR